MEEQVELLFWSVYSSFSATHIVMPSGDWLKISNYSDTPLGTAVCRSSPPLYYWDHSSHDKTPLNKLKS